MIEIVTGPEVVSWVHARLPQVGPHGFRDPKAMGIQRNGAPVAGIVFSSYSGHDMQLSIASESPLWCTRSVLREVFRFVFETAGCLRCTAVTAKHNKRARSLLERLGFRREGVHPLGFPDGSTAISYGMTRQDCRWI